MDKEKRIEEIAKATHKSFPYSDEQWDELQEDAKEPYRNFADQINALFPQVAPPEVLEATIQLRIDQALKDKFPQGDDKERGRIAKNVKEFLMNHYLVTSGDKYRLNADDHKKLDKILKGEVDGK